MEGLMNENTFYATLFVRKAKTLNADLIFGLKCFFKLLLASPQSTVIDFSAIVC
jgi:hypothetical protein